MASQQDEIVLIKACAVKIMNPRPRDRFRHGEITESIDKRGLIKPITVRRIKDKVYEYGLVCGQGRLEALCNLNEEMIPAFIIDIDEETAYLMSLAENMARTNPRAGEQFYRIKEMRERGCSDKEISFTTGFSVAWINDITMLIDKAENKLIAAVESGIVPISLAVEIARTDHEGAQELLIEAFEKGDVKHKDILRFRAILDARSEGLKGETDQGFGKHKPRQALTAEGLTKIYQENILAHRKLRIKANIVEENIILSKQILKEVMSDETFMELITSEGLEGIVGSVNNTMHEEI